MLQESIWYPPVSFYFNIDIGGKIKGSFKEVSGISVTMEEPVGEQPSAAFKLPQVNKYANLVLKRGLLNDDESFRSWYKATLGGQPGKIIKPSLLKVELLTPEGNPVMVWVFNNAWPVKINVTDLETKEETIVVEVLEFAYSNYTKHDFTTSL